jgi:hypothetical protein
MLRFLVSFDWMIVHTTQVSIFWCWLHPGQKTCSKFSIHGSKQWPEEKQAFASLLKLVVRRFKAQFLSLIVCFFSRDIDVIVNISD